MLYPNNPQLTRILALPECREICGEVKIGEKGMKFAIVESGGKQFRAVEGMTIEVDRLALEAGDKLTLDSVLLVVDEDRVTVGTPVVAGAKVSATVVDHTKGPKLIIFRYRPKKRRRVKTGHRQQYTRLLIDSIDME
jgi:large subunit ribosomal protein L21